MWCVHTVTIYIALSSNVTYQQNKQLDNAYVTYARFIDKGVYIEKKTVQYKIKKNKVEIQNLSNCNCFHLLSFRNLIS